MTLIRFQTITLGISGVTALGIGAFILAGPHAFYAGYGITLGGDASLLSESRAPAGSVIGALAVELAIAALCLTAFGRAPRNTVATYSITLR